MVRKSAASAQEEYFDLGTYTRPISTTNKDAQIWFDRGLIWTYGFNHEEAAECFKKSIHHDTACAVAYWGLAFTLGPNYNKPWDFFDDDELERTLKKVSEVARQAEKISGTASPMEQALIKTLLSRYPGDTSRKDWSRWNQAYADEMRFVYEKFPDHLDVAALFCDALMNLTPWKLWDIKTGQPAKGAYTMEVKAILDRAFTQEKAFQHPGLLHIFIHFIEMSPTPEAGLTIADQLRGLVPDAGHLQHMPSHIDVLCGDYRRAMASNLDAIRADEKFFSRTSPKKFYALYRCHDFHFRIYSAMLCGQSKVALETIAGLEAALPEELLRIESPPMADWLEAFLTMRVHALVRFGRWEDLLALELPKDQVLYCTTTAMTHYGKALALAITNAGPAKVERQRALFTAAVQRVGGSRTLFNNTCRDILQIASAMLAGEIEYRKGNHEDAFSHLREAIYRDDNLRYDEPWGWMQPTRHAYGALLLEQNRVEDAAAIYSADLGMDDSIPRARQHPNNVWALHGYHECLTRLGRFAEARILEPQLRIALAVADIPVKSSCFCRQVLKSVL
ncbi:TPR domain protein [Tothia fuscella]|uniref:TPR domain protein n=1 Tax=Tothia fuscella TaxID=1048955 RepID=A0A9P4U1Q7_9PEZI|nr:TPR domain protein [Tothia fuscella]